MLYSLFMCFYETICSFFQILSFTCECKLLPGRTLDVSLKPVPSHLWRLVAKYKAGFNMPWPSIIAEGERGEEKEKRELGAWTTTNRVI